MKGLLSYINRLKLLLLYITVLVSISIKLIADNGTSTATSAISSYLKADLSPAEVSEYLKAIERFGVGSGIGLLLIIAIIIPLVKSYIKRSDKLADEINEKVSDQNEVLIRMEHKLDASLKGVAGYISKEQSCALMENIIGSLYGNIYIFAYTNYINFNKDIVHKDYEIELMYKRIENFINNKKTEAKNTLALFKNQQICLNDFLETNLNSNALVTILKGFIVEKKTDIDSLNTVIKDEFENIMNKCNFEIK